MNKQRNWYLVAGALAMVVAAPFAARADESTPSTSTNSSSTTTTTTVTTVAFTPINIPTIAPPPMGPNGQPIDYSVLFNPLVDNVDLTQAHAEGWSDSDIATMAKIADKAGVPFHDVNQLALSGLAFPTIADRFNVRYSDIQDSSDYMDKINAYRLAYDNTGENAFRNMVAGSQQELTTTSNGTMVSGSQNIGEIISSSPDLTVFTRALRRARLMKIVRGPGPYTVFAPTDSAFAKLSTDQINTLMNDRTLLTKVIDYCIIPRRIDAADALAMSSPTSPATLEGDSLQVTNSNGSVMVNGATVVKSDMFATNGVIHEIDTVLMPTGTTITTTTTTTTNNSSSTDNESTTTPMPTPPMSTSPSVTPPPPPSTSPTP